MKPKNIRPSFAFVFFFLNVYFPMSQACAEPPPEVKREIERQLFKDANGNYHVPDNTITASDDASYDFMNADNRFKVYFKKDPYAGEYNVKYVRDGSWIAFKSISSVTIANQTFNPGLSGEGLKTEWEGGAVSMKDKNRFIYPKVFESPRGAILSAEYLISPKELLEEIVLNKEDDIRSISQEITIHNVELKEEKGAIHFYKPQTKEILFSIPKPKMYEQSNHNNENTGLRYELKELSQNHYLLTKVIDAPGRKWLADPARKYPVVIDVSIFISYGSKYVFNTGTTYDLSLCALDSTHFVAGYRDYGNSNYGTAIIGTISGTTISYGSEYVFNTAETYEISLCALDSTHFVAGYEDNGNNYYGTAIIGTVSGTTISYGSEYVFDTIISRLSLCALDSTHFVAGYADFINFSYGTAIIGTVSGTTISYGSKYVFNAGTTDGTSLCALDSTHFVAAYSYIGSPSNYGAAIIGTVSGTTISYGSKYVFNWGSTYSISLCALDSTNFVVGYSYIGSPSNYGAAIIGTVSGTTISYGSKYGFNAGTTGDISLCALDSTHFVAGYYDVNSVYATAIIGTVSGTTISYGSNYVFNALTTDYISLCALDSTHFVAGFQGRGSPNYGTAIIGRVVFRKPHVIIVE